MADSKNKRENVSSKRLMTLVTVVNRKKAEFFADLIQHLDSNMQLVTMGEGTADEKMLSYMGLTDSEKAVIISVIKEEKQDEILRVLEEKFSSIKDGKGIAFTVPFSSIIGVSVFNFLSDNRQLFI